MDLPAGELKYVLFFDNPFIIIHVIPRSVPVVLFPTFISIYPNLIFLRPPCPPARLHPYPRPRRPVRALLPTAALPHSQNPHASSSLPVAHVACDDLDVAVAGPNPTCSNCRERGIKCVDEFADVKAVKLLRRGRRLQQVEAIYGKSSEGESPSAFPRSKSIPSLQPDFFYSQFWRWFCIQRPILDAAEFSSRFLSHHQGDKPLCPEAGIVTMLLVVWAYTFGLNEHGVPNDIDSNRSESPDRHEAARQGSSPERSPPFSQRRYQSRETTQGMVQQVLELVDAHGILRRPSLDGIRALLLLLPLMEDIKPLERRAIHDTALLQVQALCTIPSGAGPASATPRAFEDAGIRARLFWYAYTQEGLLSGIRGHRFVLDAEDYDAFQRTMPLLNYGHGSNGASSPSSPPAALLTPEAQLYNRLISSSTLPSQLNMTCRKIHGVLTGPKATRRAEEHNLIDAHGMREIWNDLDRCWSEFNTIRRNASANDDSASRCDTERYACAWQIFIFECHNVIRESLREYSSSAQSPSSRPSSVSSSSPYLSPQHLHVVATRKCLYLLPKVIRIMKYCISNPRDSARPGLFVWDSGLVRDGCFFAGYLAASADEDVLDSPPDMQHGDGDDEPTSAPVSAEEGVMICLSTLSAMRWSFSRSEEREETIRMVWESRKAKRHGQSTHYPDIPFDATYPHANPHLQPAFHSANRAVMSAPTSYIDRSMLPTLNVFSQLRRAESAPSTACTTDGQGNHGWPTYTPPGTGTSIATSTSTALSIHGSPEFSNTIPTSYKQHPDDNYYHSGGDLDHFTYNVPVAASNPSDLTPAINTFSQRHGSLDGHAMTHSAHAGGYIPSHFSPGGGPMVASGTDFATCPQFGDNCNAPYH
ncbi:hypothetical protein DFP72DRAFT_1058868 [Ephemerocybe angulata]|uniref:Transcription factor domain-containing protein n=1 Tax=Ephemerocybe angulata TaxID=980116 RepID=A0A8H6IIQ9_9AGAR|nr:hypothetical protein DFP72DRAFT_1058868 [Tulosesus angulatus]